MIRNIDYSLAHVIAVIRFLQLVANWLAVNRISSLEEPAWLAAHRLKRRIHSNTNDVLPGRNRRLSIPAVKDEILSTQEEAIGICPAVTDSLIAGNANGAAVSELRALRLLAAGG